MRLRTLFSAAGLTAIATLTCHAAPGTEPLAGFRTGPGVAASPWLAPLHLHSDGKFYGGATAGGDTGNGALFQLTPSGKLEWLSYTGIGGNMPGEKPQGTLLRGADGWLWGTTTEGGTGLDFGTVFRFQPENGEYQVVANFNSSTPGRYPMGQLTADNNGWLWGVTNMGGVGIGVIYKIHSQTGEYVPAVVLPSGSGNPSGPSSILFHSGYLWITAGGGTHSNGIIQRMDPITLARVTVGEFTGTSTVAGKPR
ncbi:MAG TPA: choice-of-anchor tandem repeat GloVer-containing protein, partial [Prosthecobacter sp.]|nr:choice-of-anchor tandem repeat GloVer-containing protein [Prosthecobacter sp.]